jgi:hypothetical protein
LLLGTLPPILPPFPNTKLAPGNPQKRNFSLTAMVVVGDDFKTVNSDQ